MNVSASYPQKRKKFLAVEKKQIGNWTSWIHWKSFRGKQVSKPELLHEITRIL